MTCRLKEANGVVGRVPLIVGWQCVGRFRRNSHQRSSLRTGNGYCIILSISNAGALGLLLQAMSTKPVKNRADT